MPRMRYRWRSVPGMSSTELDSRQEPRLVKALEMVAPGTALREGIDNILHASTGGLIVIGDPDELSFLFSGGIKLDIDYTPGAASTRWRRWTARSSSTRTRRKIAVANVQLMPDPTILSLETGTRHRTAERVSKQTDALVIAISQRREVVSLYVDGAKYILEDIPVVLAKANQALATLDKYRTRLDQVSTRLTALEFEGGATLHDVLTVLQRSELVTRMAVEIERYIVELGTEGRLIEMQLEETMVGAAADKAALVHDYLAEDSDEAFAARAGPDRPAPAPGPAGLRAPRRAARLRPQGQHPRLSGLAPRLPDPRPHPAAAEARGRSRSCTSSAASTRCWPRPTPSSRRSRASARSARRTSARACAGCRRSTSSTATCRPDAHTAAAGGRPRATTQGGHHSATQH